MEKVIERARSLLAFLPPEEAAGSLMGSGIDAGDAFLAVKAARILVQEESRSRAESRFRRERWFV